jgi:SpoVK/Ycf46/Vps4 family AAA+-type ATPase
MSTVDNLLAKLAKLAASWRKSNTLADLVDSHPGVDRVVDHTLEQARRIAKAFKSHEPSHKDKDWEGQPLAAALPKGLVIYGHGCGCGGLSRAIAKEVNAHFISGTTCAATGRALGPDAIAHYFKQAKELAQVAKNAKNAKDAKNGKVVMLYLGGVNFLANQAALLNSAAEAAQATTAAIAREIEDLAACSSVLVVLEAEKLSQIDATLLADGRFDVQIEVEKPDYKGRLTIFRQHLESWHDLPQPQSKSSSQLQGVQILVSLDGAWREERLAELDQICQECAVLADGLHADHIYRALFQLRTQSAVTGSVTAEQLYQAIENQQGKP